MQYEEICKELNELLRLKTDPVAYKRLEKESDLAKIKDMVRLAKPATFCQVIFMARVLRLTVGISTFS